MKRLILALFLLVAAPALAAPALAAPTPPNGFSPQAGTVPGFRFQQLDGTEDSIDPYLGQKVLIVNFWATWCPPCVKEMPSLDKLAGILPKDKYRVFAVAMQKEVPEVEGFFKRANIQNLKPFLDPQMMGARAFGLRGVPATVIIGPNGMIGRVDGEQDWASPQMVEWLKSLS